jgi:hypothetical protein
MPSQQPFSMEHNNIMSTSEEPEYAKNNRPAQLLQPHTRQVLDYADSSVDQSADYPPQYQYAQQHAN